MSPAWASSVQALDARGEHVRTRTAWSWPGHGLPTATLWFDEAGTYTLIPPELPGLAALERAEALVREGDRTVVTFVSVPEPVSGE